MHYTFSDNTTGANITVTMTGRHRAQLVVNDRKGNVVGAETIDINYEPRFGWDHADIRTMNAAAVRIQDGR